MPKITVDIPPLSTERADQATVSVRGLGMRNLGDNKLIWSKIPVIHARAPTVSSFNVNIDPALEANSRYDLPAIDQLKKVQALTSVEENLRRDFFTYGDHISGGVFCRHNDNTIRNVKTEGESDNDIQTSPDTIGYPITFRGFIYIIYPNGEIYKMNELGEGGIRITTNLNEAKQKQNIAVGTDSDVITGVSRWLNRVWIQWGGPPGRLFYSEINNITNWLAVNDATGRVSTAGVYTTTDKILGFEPFGNTGLLFTDNDIVRVTVSDVQFTWFSFVEMNYKDIFAGGAITKQRALHYVSETGISRMTDGGIQHISSAVNNVVLDALSGEHTVNVSEKGRFIVWSFNDNNNTVLFFDSIDGTWSYRQGLDVNETGNRIVAVGDITQIGKSIGSFDDRNGNPLRIGDIEGSYDLFATTGVKSCGVFDDGSVKFFDTPSELQLSCLLERTDFGQGVFIRSMALPEMSSGDFYIQIRDLDYSTGTKTYHPNKYNEVLVQNKFSTPEITFVITKPKAINSLSRFELDAEVVRY